MRSIIFVLALFLVTPQSWAQTPEPETGDERSIRETARDRAELDIVARGLERYLPELNAKELRRLSEELVSLDEETRRQIIVGLRDETFGLGGVGFREEGQSFGQSLMEHLRSGQGLADFGGRVTNLPTVIRDGSREFIPEVRTSLREFADIETLREFYPITSDEITDFLIEVSERTAEYDHQQTIQEVGAEEAHELDSEEVSLALEEERALLVENLRIQIARIERDVEDYTALIAELPDSAIHLRANAQNLRKIKHEKLRKLREILAFLESVDLSQLCAYYQMREEVGVSVSQFRQWLSEDESADFEELEATLRGVIAGELQRQRHRLFDQGRMGKIRRQIDYASEYRKELLGDFLHFIAVQEYRRGLRLDHEGVEENCAHCESAAMVEENNAIDGLLTSLSVQADRCRLEPGFDYLDRSTLEERVERLFGKIWDWLDTGLLIERDLDLLRAEIAKPSYELPISEDVSTPTFQDATLSCLSQCTLMVMKAQGRAAGLEIPRLSVRNTHARAIWGEPDQARVYEGPERAPNVFEVADTVARGVAPNWAVPWNDVDDDGNFRAPSPEDRFFPAAGDFPFDFYTANLSTGMERPTVEDYEQAISQNQLDPYYQVYPIILTPLGFDEEEEWKTYDADKIEKARELAEGGMGHVMVLISEGQGFNVQTNRNEEYFVVWDSLNPGGFLQRMKKPDFEDVTQVSVVTDIQRREGFIDGRSRPVGPVVNPSNQIPTFSDRVAPPRAPLPRPLTPGEDR